MDSTLKLNTENALNFVFLLKANRGRNNPLQWCKSKSWSQTRSNEDLPPWYDLGFINTGLREDLLRDIALIRSPPQGPLVPRPANSSFCLLGRTLGANCCLWSLFGWFLHRYVFGCWDGLWYRTIILIVVVCLWFYNYKIQVIIYVKTLFLWQFWHLKKFIFSNKYYFEFLILYER